MTSQGGLLPTILAILNVTDDGISMANHPEILKEADQLTSEEVENMVPEENGTDVEEADEPKAKNKLDKLLHLGRRSGMLGCIIVHASISVDISYILEFKLQCLCHQIKCFCFLRVLLESSCKHG